MEARFASQSSKDKLEAAQAAFHGAAEELTAFIAENSTQSSSRLSRMEERQIQ